MDLKLRNVSELQAYLKSRGVVISGLKKAELVSLCSEAEHLGIAIDPDGILESRSEVVKSKLKVILDDSSTVELPLPALLSGGNDLSLLPLITSFDVLNYLASSNSDDYSMGALREFTKLESYGMWKDGFVLDVKTGQFEERGFFFIQFQVKPRTNAADPTTGLPYYTGWIILSSSEKRARILNAYCCCRGGIDGYCRHVAATLFDVIHFLDDRGSSVTSAPCAWYFRGLQSGEQSAEVTELQLSAVDKPRSSKQKSAKRRVPLPNVTHGLEKLDKVLPGATLFTMVRSPKRSLETSLLSVQSPEDYLEAFFNFHQCTDECKCGHVFLNTCLRYSKEEIKTLEVETRGQNKNKNWHSLRKFLLTASNFKKICKSTDGKKTAKALLKGTSLNEDRLPFPIRYGRDNEDRARKLFLDGHRLCSAQCRNCKVQQTGLIINQTNNILACSPDGILSCVNGESLIEIKCIAKYRKYYPLNAAKMSEIVFCSEDDDTIKIVEDHQYNYQIQGQMGVTGIKKAYLIIYTDKGIFPLLVPFNPQFWNECCIKLLHFYHTYFFPSLKDLEQFNAK